MGLLATLSIGAPPSLAGNANGTIYGVNGTKRVSADVFRSVINTRKASTALPIRSNLFELIAPTP